MNQKLNCLILILSLLSSHFSFADGLVIPPDSLRTLGGKVGIRMGVAIKTDQLANPLFLTTIGEQFREIVSEYQMKMKVISPQQGVYNFAPADTLVEAAIYNKQVVHGHALIWTQSTPTWITNGNFTSSQMLSILRKYITATVSHFKDKYPHRVLSWDVVNEAVSNDGQGKHPTPWSLVGNSTIGKDSEAYIREAFRVAHEADPDAKLYYNDYGAEVAGAKFNGVYNLVRRLKLAGVPIYGVGLQAHFSTDYGVPSVSMLRATIKKFGTLGLKVRYSELDVRTKSIDGVSSTEKTRYQELYQNVTEACRLEKPTCVAITVWNILPNQSWIPNYFPGYSAILPFNNSLKPNSVYRIIQTGLK